MPEVNPLTLQKLETKLKNLVDCVLKKASTDLEFAHQLEEILLSDLLYKEAQISSAKDNKKSIKSKKQNFNAVEYLHKHDQEKLREELNFKTDNELKQILREGGNSKIRIPKNTERQKLIDDIVTQSIRTLKQGSSFL